MFLSYSDTIWGKYFACRTSSASFPLTADRILEITKNIRDMETYLCIKRKEYNLRKMNLGKFVECFRNYFQLILNKAAYVAGNAYLYNDEDRTKYVEIVDEQLTSSQFSSCWYNLYSELAVLFDSFPNWAGIEVFDGLGQVIKRYSEQYDIHLSDTPQGVYFSIPVHLE